MFDVLADFVVFHQQVGELFFRCIPPTSPTNHDPGSEGNGIDFLSHSVLLSCANRKTNPQSTPGI
jgi:hypothetical protein